MKKSLCALGCACLFLTSCVPVDKEDTQATVTTEFANLDLSGAVLKFNEPTSGKWHELVFDGVLEFDKDVTVIRDLVEKSGYSFDKENLYYIVNRPEDLYHIKYDDMTENDYAAATYVVYDDGEIWVEYNYGGMVQMAFPGKCKELMCLKEGDELPNYYWPSYVGKSCRNLSSDNDGAFDEKYLLGSTLLSVNDVKDKIIDNLESIKYKAIDLQDFSFEASSATVYEYANGTYGFNILYKMIYDGVPFFNFEGDTWESKEREEGDTSLKHISIAEFHAGTYSGTQCDYLWTNPFMYGCYEVLDIDKILTYEEACKAVSDYLSPDNVFTITKVELVYGFVVETQYDPVFTYEDGMKKGEYSCDAEPVYAFTVCGVNESNVVYKKLNVLAKTGEILVQNHYSYN